MPADSIFPIDSPSLVADLGNDGVYVERNDCTRMEFVWAVRRCSVGYLRHGKRSRGRGARFPRVMSRICLRMLGIQDCSHIHARWKHGKEMVETCGLQRDISYIHITSSDQRLEFFQNADSCMRTKGKIARELPTCLSHAFLCLLCLDILLCRPLRSKNCLPSWQWLSIVHLPGHEPPTRREYALTPALDRTVHTICQRRHGRADAPVHQPQALQRPHQRIAGPEWPSRHLPRRPVVGPRRGERRLARQRPPPRSI